MIEAIVDSAIAAGRLKPRQRRRIMSYPLVIRLMIAMTLTPGASYLHALAGLLADIPSSWNGMSRQGDYGLAAPCH